MLEKVKIVMKGKVGIVLIGILLLAGYHFLITPSGMKKIGVVQMDKLVYEYQGMKDATEMFSGKITGWSSKSDSIKKKLEDYLYDIKMDSINGDKEKMKIDQQKFMLLRQNYMEYQQTLEQNSQQEDQKMTVGVINQLKEHMNDFAKENGYDLLITNRQMESVGFVEEKYDVTSDLLKFANEHYNGDK